MIFFRVSFYKENELSDDDDTASPTFLGDVNKDMCHGLPYTPLGWCIQDFFKFHFQITSKAPNWVTCQRFSARLYSWQMCIRFLGIFSSQLFKRPSPTQPSQNPGNGQPHISNRWQWEQLYDRSSLQWHVAKQLKSTVQTTFQNYGSFRWAEKPSFKSKDSCSKGQRTFGGLEMISNPRTSKVFKFASKSL